MINEIEKTLEVLEKLNAQLGKHRILTKEEIEEEYANISDFAILKKELNSLLEDLQGSADVDETCKLIIELHLKILDYIWHYDQLHELVRKMAGNYREQTKLLMTKKDN